MLNQVTDKVRFAIAEMLASESGNHLKPVRIIREALGTANDLVGRPFCTPEELSERRGTSATEAVFEAAKAAKHEPAPVIVYFDGKDQRSRIKIEEILKGRSIAYQVCDVTDDESN